MRSNKLWGLGSPLRSLKTVGALIQGLMDSSF